MRHVHARTRRDEKEDEERQRSRRRGASVEGGAEKCHGGGVSEEAGGGGQRRRHGQPTRKKRADVLLRLGDAPPVLAELERHAPLCLLRRRPERKREGLPADPKLPISEKEYRHLHHHHRFVRRRWGAAFPAKLLVAPLVGLSMWHASNPHRPLASAARISRSHSPPQ